MKKIYKLYIGVLLSVIAVSCTDSLDSDKYFTDRRCEDDKDDGKEARSQKARGQKGGRHKSRKEKSLIHFT